jgi:tetratricopeptide (TPR) repeat protein
MLLVLTVYLLVFTGCRAEEPIQEDVQPVISESELLYLQEVEDYKELLPEINQNLEISFDEIDYLFAEFHDDYRWVVVMNYVTITSSMIVEMEDYQSDIAVEITKIKQAIAQYEEMDANLLEFIQEEQDIVVDIEEKIGVYDAHAEQLGDCLESMNTYDKLLDIFRKQLNEIEEYENLLRLTVNQIDSEKYDDAIDNLNILKSQQDEFKSLTEYFSDLGVLPYNGEELKFHEFMIDFFDTLAEYIGYLEDEDYDEAEEMFDDLSESYTESLQRISESGTLVEFHDEIDSWYYKNIKSCMEIFEE